MHLKIETALRNYFLTKKEKRNACLHVWQVFEAVGLVLRRRCHGFRSQILHGLQQRDDFIGFGNWIALL